MHTTGSYSRIRYFTSTWGDRKGKSAAQGGAFSSILGGSGNTIGAGYNNAHIIGSGIVLGPGVGNPNSLHINGLWANGIPLWPVVAPTGTVVQVNSAGPFPLTGGPLWIL